MRYFEIIGQNSVVVEISGEKLTRNLYAKGKRIYFFNGMVIGEYDTPERTAEVWKDLKQAAQDGEESFSLPET